MNGSEFAKIRNQLGFTAAEGHGEADFARLLGYTGSFRNRADQIRKFESGRKQIPLYIARLAWLLGEIDTECDLNPSGWPDYVNDVGKVEFPEWDGYVIPPDRVR